MKSNAKRWVARAPAPRTVHLASVSRWASRGSTSVRSGRQQWPRPLPLRRPPASCPPSRRHFRLRLPLISALLGFRPRWSLPKGATASSISGSWSFFLGQWRSRTLSQCQPPRGGGPEPGVDPGGGPWRKRPEALSKLTERARCGCRRHGRSPSRPGTAGGRGPGVAASSQARAPVSECGPRPPEPSGCRGRRPASPGSLEAPGSPALFQMPPRAWGRLSSLVSSPHSGLGTRFCPSSRDWWKGLEDSRVVRAFPRGFITSRESTPSPSPFSSVLECVFQGGKAFEGFSPRETVRTCDNYQGKGGCGLF